MTKEKQSKEKSEIIDRMKSLFKRKKWILVLVIPIGALLAFMLLPLTIAGGFAYFFWRFIKTKPLLRYVIVAGLVLLGFWGTIAMYKDAGNRSPKNEQTVPPAKEETPKETTKEEPKIEESKEKTQEMSEDSYRARISLAGEKITKAGQYIEESASYLDSGDYKGLENINGKAWDQLNSSKFIFEAQTNPPAKYKEFNNNMINLLRNLLSVNEEITFSISENYTSIDATKINSAVERGNRIINEMNKELEKVGL